MLRPAVTRSISLFYSPHYYGSSVLLLPRDSRSFSVLNRPKPNYEGHVPLTGIEKTFLGVCSAFGALMNPKRGDLVACFAETTCNIVPGFNIKVLRDAMLSNETGRRILCDRPRFDSKTVPIEYLRGLPQNTFGRCLADYYDENGIYLDERGNVKYIDNAECAYVMQRYRECHDVYHALTGLPAIYKETEVALKGFEAFNVRLPVAFLSMLYVPWLKPEERSRFVNVYFPWGMKNGLDAQLVMNVYWEEEWTADVDELRKRLRITKAPDVRKFRKADRAKKIAQDRV